MTKKPDIGPESGNQPDANASAVQAWFVREVLPLEAALMQFLRRRRRNTADADDLRHDIYVRVCEAAQKEIPHPARPFVFAIARNLVIDHARRDHVVPIDAVADIDALNVAADMPGPESSAIAREELRALQEALDRLPQRCREAVVLRKIEGLPRREIAVRMGIAEKTVRRHIGDGMRALADALYRGGRT
jgi:RNA polymerase sigma-70 factor (ECF subfamily)